MQGLAGGAVGAVAGALFSLGNALIIFGTAALIHVSWVDVSLSVSAAIGIGFLLSLVGVLYPAVIAARMQPVEAMRVEQ